MNRSNSSILRSGLSVLLIWGLASGCGNLTAGGVGEASVAMSGDAPDDGPTPQMSVVSGPAQTSHDADGGSGEDDPEGQIEADLSVFLVAADGDLVPMTDGQVRVRVDLQGVEEPEIASRSVTATTYTHLRMVFTEIDVEVDAGLIINGEPVVGSIDVEIDDASLTVERPIDVEIGDGERVDLLIDLNADSWLQAVDPTAIPPTVDAQVFADLVTVRVR